MTFLTLLIYYSMMQQEHLPKDQQATPQQEYGFAFEDFINDQWPYLVGILLLLVIFFYARYNWRKKRRK